MFLSKLAVIFSVEQLLCHLQHVLETHEVNWKHVLCFLSTLLVYNPHAQPSLRGNVRQTPIYLLYWVSTTYSNPVIISTILMRMLKCTYFSFLLQ